MSELFDKATKRINDYPRKEKKRIKKAAEKLSIIMLNEKVGYIGK